MYDDIRFIVGFFSFWTGATIASFLNVVIWRVPRGESIVSPPSHCPKCGAAIRWWQNIPILSWLALRGKCASCRAPISPRYIFVEALGGALFLAAFLKYGGALAGVICGMRHQDPFDYENCPYNTGVSDCYRVNRETVELLPPEK